VLDPAFYFFPAGPVLQFDGLEVLHFELGTLGPAQSVPVNLAYGVGSDKTELQQVMDEAVGSASWLSVNPESGVVPAGGSADVAVTFDPGTFPTGDYAARILVDSNDPDEAQVVGRRDAGTGRHGGSAPTAPE
jgi:hypothetical protein